VRVRGRSVGLLVVKVVEAEGLKKMDTFGKSDPFVEMYTQAQQMEKTARALLSKLNPNPCPISRGCCAGHAVQQLEKTARAPSGPKL